MTPGLKLFFDECCSKRLARKIVDVYSECYPGVSTKHLFDACEPSASDSDWLAILEKEKDWIVLTADRGKDPKREKLPLICQRLGITHISLTPALQHARYTVQKQALLSVWPQIMKTPLLPKPTRVSLGFKMIDRGLTRAPYLSIENMPFAIWCQEKGVDISN